MDSVHVKGQVKEAGTKGSQRKPTKVRWGTQGRSLTNFRPALMLQRRARLTRWRARQVARQRKGKASENTTEGAER